MAQKFLWTYNNKALKTSDGNFYFAIPDPSISVDPSTYSYPLAGGSKSFIVTNTLYADWNIDTLPAWITYGMTSSGFDTSCNANNTGSSRYGNIDLNIPKLGSGVHLQIPVGQTYSTPSLSVSPNSYQFSGSGESKQFIVTSNVPWDVSTWPAWISINSKTGQSGNGSFYGYASQNTGSYRSGSIVMKCTSYPDLYPAGYTISVSQPQGTGPTTMYWDYPYLDFDYNQNACNQNWNDLYTDATDWQISYIDQGYDTWWGSVYPTSGSGNYPMGISVSYNSGAYRTMGVFAQSQSYPSLNSQFNIIQYAQYDGCL